MKIKLNTHLNGHKNGDVIEIKDDNGIPLDAYWRNRLKDSEYDNCISVVENKKTNKVKEPVEETEQVEEKKGIKKIKKSAII